MRKIICCIPKNYWVEKARRIFTTLLPIVSASLFSTFTLGQDETSKLCNEEAIIKSDTIRIYILWDCTASFGYEEIELTRFHKGWYKVHCSNSWADVVKRSIYKNRIKKAWKIFTAMDNFEQTDYFHPRVEIDLSTNKCSIQRFPENCDDTKPVIQMKHGLKIWAHEK
ncbi:MAG: hypothetical protein SH856_07160 [Flavobacteriales bacterium]|nr:hypothetical protein [Flavobacteriales bacterium]